MVPNGMVLFGIAKILDFEAVNYLNVFVFWQGKFNITNTLLIQDVSEKMFFPIHRNQSSLARSLQVICKVVNAMCKCAGRPVLVKEGRRNTKSDQKITDVLYTGCS